MSLKLPEYGWKILLIVACAAMNALRHSSEERTYIVVYGRPSTALEYAK